MKTKPIQNIKLATLLWVMSCTEKSSLITYQSIADKTNNENIGELKNLVKLFPELFKDQVSEKLLVDWKSQMLNGGNRTERLDNITTDDVYCNRFINSTGADIVDKSIIQWGINHISQYFVAKEEFWKKIIPLVLPLLLILVLALSLFLFSNKAYENHEIDSEKTEVKIIEFKSNLIYPKYNSFVDRLGKSLLFGLYYNNKMRNNELDYVRVELYKLMPFISKTDFDSINQLLTDYQKLVTKYDVGQTLTESQEEEIFYKYLELIKNLWEAINNQELKVDNVK